MNKQMKSAKFTASPTGDCGLFNFCGILNFSFLTLPLFSLIFVGNKWDYFSVQVSKYTGQYAEVPARITSVTTAIDRSSLELKTEDGTENFVLQFPPDWLKMVISIP